MIKCRFFYYDLSLRAHNSTLKSICTANAV